MDCPEFELLLRSNPGAGYCCDIRLRMRGVVDELATGITIEIDPESLRALSSDSGAYGLALTQMVFRADSKLLDAWIIARRAATQAKLPLQFA